MNWLWAIYGAMCFFVGGLVVLALHDLVRIYRGKRRNPLR